MAKKRRKKKFDAEKYDKQHLRNLDARSREIDELYKEVAREAARIGEATKFSDPSKPFYLSSYPAAQRRIDSLVSSFGEKLLATIKNGNKEEWLLSNAKNDEMVETIVSSTQVSKQRLRQFNTRNLEGLKAFQERKINGTGLSDRVWRLTQQTKGEIELALDVGLGEGRSADQLSRDVRSSLKEPNRLFRRVRDKHGALRLSKSAAEYHPGQGVYRSSYKNALRLTATENNTAYRTADHERWQRIDFVIGIEIQLSNNHPCKDMCDELAGKYPKGFKFTGWHPQCRCHAVAILPSHEEFIRYQQAKIDGEDVSDWKFKGEITEMPANWNKWVNENSDRIDRAAERGTLPYFLKDNRGYVGNNPRYGLTMGSIKPSVSREAGLKEYEGIEPVTLTKLQQENINRISKSMKTEITPMTFKEANEGKANINYGKNVDYKINCQMCVIVHEARLRGLNITSLPYNGDKNGHPYKLGNDIGYGWINPKTGKHPKNQSFSPTDDDDAYNLLEKNMSVPGRYNIGFDFKDGFGHTLIAERLPNKKLVIYDPQDGAFHDLKDFVDIEKFQLLKVDKLLLNQGIFTSISKVI